MFSENIDMVLFLYYSYFLYSELFLSHEGHDQISGETVGEVRIVSDMHERKAEMAREADAFIALPGRYSVP